MKGMGGMSDPVNQPKSSGTGLPCYFSDDIGVVVAGSRDKAAGWLHFICYGKPVPQGSKVAGRRKDGGLFLRDTAKGLAGWRKHMTETFIRQHDGNPAVDGPLVLHAVFLMPRPKGPKYHDWPAVMPDKSKLLRALEDSLTKAGVWKDDCLPCVGYIVKRFAMLHEEPGVSVSIRPATEEDLLHVYGTVEPFPRAKRKKP